MRNLKSSRTLTAGLLFLLVGSNSLAQALPPGLPQKAMALAPLAIKNQLLLRKHMMEYTAAILKVNPKEALQKKSVSPNEIRDLSEMSTTDEEKQLLKIWADMINDGTLKPGIEKLIAELKQGNNSISAQLKALPASQEAYVKNALAASIEATVRIRGLTTDSKNNQYIEWADLSNEMLKKVNATQAGSDNILALSKSSWVKTRHAEILVDGPASFAKRDLIMGDATQSINILTWSIYDDMTGAQAADLLIAKKQANKDLKIRIIVDAQVAATGGHGDQVKRLEDAGIEVIRWFSTSKPFAGQHRKMIITDNSKMVAGGLNFGDVYSHRNPDPKIARWRDTDIYIEGTGAAEGNRLFAQIWNEQIAERNLKLQPIEVVSTLTSAADENVEISLINHDAVTTQGGSTVMLTILKAIRTAKTQIDIENAYIILFPALKTEIQEAIKRGVKVRVFTNSGESVDEPIVSIPILRSVTQFSAMGAEVYVKKGATLHSKLIVVDSEYSMIMSYNLHPRSERLEGEMMVLVKDTKLANQLHQVFSDDVTSEKAYKINSPSEVKMPDSPVSFPTLRIFFDML